MTTDAATGLSRATARSDRVRLPALCVQLRWGSVRRRCGCGGAAERQDQPVVGVVAQDQPGASGDQCRSAAAMALRLDPLARGRTLAAVTGRHARIIRLRTDNDRLGGRSQGWW